MVSARGIHIGFKKKIMTCGIMTCELNNLEIEWSSVFSPDVILTGWLGSKHQLLTNPATSFIPIFEDCYGGILWRVPSETDKLWRYFPFTYIMWVCHYNVCDCRHVYLEWGCLSRTKRGGNFLALRHRTKQAKPSSDSGMRSSFGPYDFHQCSTHMKNWVCALISV